MKLVALIFYSVLIVTSTFADAGPIPSVDVKIMAWNTYMLPKPFKFTQQNRRTNLVAEMLAHTDRDIIMLEEAFSSSFKKKISDTLRKNYPYQVSLGRDRKITHVFSSGLLVFSKWPVRMIDYAYFKKCTKGDCFAAKGVLLLEVELPYGKLLHLASTRLNLGTADKSVSTRTTQLGQISNLYKQKSQQGIPVVLAGDLNIEADSSEFKEALKLLSMENAPVLNSEVPSHNYDIPCYKRVKDPSSNWVDHILLNKVGSEAQILDQRFHEFFGDMKGGNCALSDHQAIEATIRL
jgi:endonuclease/exonuclease/phosphatase family metal-dependent hydrolase